MLVRNLIIGAGVALTLGAAVAFAASEGEKPEDYKFSFESPTGGYDMAAVQRGFEIYSQVCSTCHAMRHLSYRNLGEEGGPFAAYEERDEATGEMKLREVPGPPEHGGHFVQVTDNPWVRSIAAGVTISDIDPSTGQPADRPGRISDHFRSPFPNEAASRMANGGAYPPDLSEIVQARAGGADYVRSLLQGYTGETRGTQYVNRYFAGHLISMPPPLTEGRVTYADGTTSTVAQEATDVATFLQWAADPHMAQRKALGLQVIAFLLVLAGLLYLAYKQVWKGESH
jgi:ubiquinol-cytochrome c reductase cytochrome c1 subunit